MKDLEFTYKTLKKKPFLKEQHKENRLKFSKAHLSDNKKWKRVFFSDEKRFLLEGPDCISYYWVGSESDQNFYTGTRSNPRLGLMVWGVFSYKFKPNLFFLEGKIDSKKYIKMIKNHFLEFIRDNQIENYIFQQDNCSIHVSKYSLRKFEELEIPLLPWPSKSHDLNPMENLWSILVKEVYRENLVFDSIYELKNSIINAWEKIDSSTLKNLCNSMENRLINVIKRDGDFIKF